MRQRKIFADSGAAEVSLEVAWRNSCIADVTGRYRRAEMSAARYPTKWRSTRPTLSAALLDGRFQPGGFTGR